jgi:hypothetical protein
MLSTKAQSEFFQPAFGVDFSRLGDEDIPSIGLMIKQEGANKRLWRNSCSNCGETCVECGTSAFPSREELPNRGAEFSINRAPQRGLGQLVKPHSDHPCIARSISRLPCLRSRISRSLTYSEHSSSHASSGELYALMAQLMFSLPCLVRHYQPNGICQFVQSSRNFDGKYI